MAERADTVEMTILGGLANLCSVAGLIAAVLIYIRQGHQSEQWANKINDNTIEAVRRYAGQVSQDPEADSGAEEVDSFDEETPLIESLGLDLGGGVRAFGKNDVPLGIIHKIVEAWRREGKAGDWAVGNLLGALRKTGRGNHPWYLAFEDSGQTRLWKLSDGGQRKSEPTLTEMPPPSHTELASTPP